MSINSIYNFDYTKYKTEIINILNDVSEIEKKDMNWNILRKIIAKNIKGSDKFLSKQQIIKGSEELVKIKHPNLPSDPNIVQKLQMKPIRTQSGVTPVTVLTKPFPCPGKCIFCPNDIRMPKSYLSDEPGAQRAARNNFDPYLQVYDRLRAYKNIGHSTSKIELIILGGTWSYYPEGYQIWFIRRCFEAMNDFGNGVDNTELIEYNGLDKKAAVEIEQAGKIIRNQDDNSGYNKTILEINKEINKVNKSVEQSSWDELFDCHRLNESSDSRCIGMVIETRPDRIDEAEVVRIRKLGCTKVQMGVQSLNDAVLDKNHRGHSVQDSAHAINLLREAGFKIHLHWMANLYGSSPNADIEDYKKLFTDKRFCPDELKVYPCSLLETAELTNYYKDGRWAPYSEEELKSVVLSAILSTPQYCRLTRIIRDIPSTDILVGNKKTNFRQLVQNDMKEKGVSGLDIRVREIRGKKVSKDDLHLDIVRYDTDFSNELFLQYVTDDNQIAGFLRLSIPICIDPSEYKHSYIKELDGCAMIREIHVYGSAVDVGESKKGKAQHSGIGKALIKEAKNLSKEAKFTKLAVISSIGTRQYYSNRGFNLIDLYQVTEL